MKDADTAARIRQLFAKDPSVLPTPEINQVSLKWQDFLPAAGAVFGVVQEEHMNGPNVRLEDEDDVKTVYTNPTLAEAVRFLHEEFSDQTHVVTPEPGFKGGTVWSVNNLGYSADEDTWNKPDDSDTGNNGTPF